VDVNLWHYLVCATALQAQRKRVCLNDPLCARCPLIIHLHQGSSWTHITAVVLMLVRFEQENRVSSVPIFSVYVGITEA
jgi:hypothetical protein